MELDIYSPAIIHEEPHNENDMMNLEERPNKRRRKKSIVWEHFTIEPAGPSRMKACCKHCKKSFAYINGPKLAGTSHLKRHISLGICTGRLQTTEITEVASGTKTDPPKRRYRTNSGYAGIPFDQDRCTGDIAKMIIQHNYPLHIVEHASFIEFVRALHPQYIMASYNSIQGECVALYMKEKQNLLAQINEIPGRVNLTLDLATSNLSIGYAFLRGHFIDRDWNLQQRILNVIMLPFPESEYGFNQAIISCTSDWHLENKLFTVTVDESISSEGIMRNVRSLLPAKNSLLMNGQLLKGTCFSRLLSRLAQDAMKIAQEPIMKVRECVKYIKTSETHEEKFSELRQQLQVPSTKELVIDDQAKWNTTYEMLVAACELKEVFGCFDTADPVYKINPSVDDWNEVEIICTYLKLFFEAASILTSPVPQPTNLFYHEVSKIQLELSHASSSQDHFVSILTKPLKDKFDQYWNDCFLVLAIAVVMDPRFKMKLVEFSFTKLFGEDAGSWIKAVDDGIHELFLDYIAHGSYRPNHSDVNGVTFLSHMDGSLQEFSSLDGESMHMHEQSHEGVLVSQIDGSSEFSHFQELHHPQAALTQEAQHHESYSVELFTQDLPSSGVSHLDENLYNQEVTEEKNVSPDSVLEQNARHEEPVVEIVIGKEKDEQLNSQELPAGELNAEKSSVEQVLVEETFAEDGAQKDQCVNMDEQNEVQVNEDAKVDAISEEINAQEVAAQVTIDELPVAEVNDTHGGVDTVKTDHEVQEDENQTQKQFSMETNLQEASLEVSEEASSQDVRPHTLPSQELHSKETSMDIQGAHGASEEQLMKTEDGIGEEPSNKETPMLKEELHSAENENTPDASIAAETSMDIEEAQVCTSGSHETGQEPQAENLSSDFHLKDLHSSEVLPQQLSHEASDQFFFPHEPPHEVEHQHQGEEFQNPEGNPVLSSGDGFSDFEVYISAIGNHHMKSELDQYLEESLLPRTQEFDILGWWKLNRLKFPTLSKLAADILSIPLSTVAPESVFDTMNKKLDSYYGSLHPLTLEAIICAKDWLRGSPSTPSNLDLTNSVTKIDF